MTTPLPDPLALHLVTTFAAPRLRASSAVPPPTPDFLAALADTFGPAPASPPPTDADLARAAIAVAAEDPATRDAIDGLLDAGTPPTYGPGLVETVAVVTAALVILQTEVHIERTPAGKYKVKLDVTKEAASDGLLKALAYALMRALGAGQGDATPRLPK